MADNNKIEIHEAICDSCGVIGKKLYALYYSNGRTIDGTYCYRCAEERRDELAE
jgi:hypothetical protein